MGVEDVVVPGDSGIVVDSVGEYLDCDDPAAVVPPAVEVKKKRGFASKVRKTIKKVFRGSKVEQLVEPECEKSKSRSSKPRKLRSRRHYGRA